VAPQANGQAAASGNVQKYLVPAYRVAMLAVESMGRRLNDERPAVKFAKTPSYAEDVKWLHTVAQKLGMKRDITMTICC